MKSNSWILLLLAAALVVVSWRLAVATQSETPQTVNPADAVIENIMTRSSVRSYSDREVPDSVVETILKAGMAAPCAANQQAWEFMVITSQALKDSIAASFRNAKMVASCNFAVVVCGNTDNLFKDDLPEGGFWVQDCSAATENMLLAAHALGLGAVWCGVTPMKDREAIVARLLELPANLKPLNIIAFGYPTAPNTPKDKWNPDKIHYYSDPK